MTIIYIYTVIERLIAVIIQPRFCALRRRRVFQKRAIMTWMPLN